MDTVQDNVIDFSKIKETRNLLEIKIENKEKYYFDLINLEESRTGRIDVEFTNTFFREAIQLIVNALSLFEKGYFDCAFYSLRQSLEISTTAIYISDDEDEKRDIQLKNWRAKVRFAMQSEMISKLEKRNLIFADIKDKMKLYFDELDVVKSKLNKYVHKQGFDTFYVGRSNFHFPKDKWKDLLADFEHYLVKCIGAIGVFRLAIDPLPILLADEEIYKRTDRFLTEPYTNDFINTYIGDNHIVEYKKTRLYQDHYEYFIQHEEMLEPVLDLVKDQFIDRKNIDTILAQRHVLGLYDTVALSFVILTNKIAKVYAIGGLFPYYTDVKTTRVSHNFDSEDFNIREQQAPVFNTKYDEAFLSCVKINGESYFIEHNYEFNISEKDGINNIVNRIESQLKELEEKLNQIIINS